MDTGTINSSPDKGLERKTLLSLCGLLNSSIVSLIFDTSIGEGEYVKDDMSSIGVCLGVGVCVDIEIGIGIGIGISPRETSPLVIEYGLEDTVDHTVLSSSSSSGKILEKSVSVSVSV
jgi:hypothetical protein